MTPEIPAWARQSVSPDVHDFSDVRQLHGDGRTQIQLPDLKELKGWAKSHDTSSGGSGRQGEN